jgi:hypothetical protein
MNIKLHIERLVLDSLSTEPVNGPEVQATVAAELKRLLGDGDGPIAPELISGGAAPRLSAPGIQLTPDSNPIQVGQKIAHAVYQGLRQF